MLVYRVKLVYIAALHKGSHVMVEEAIQTKVTQLTNF